MATCAVTLKNAADETVSSFSESEIVAGGCKVLLTLTGDTWITSGGETVGQDGLLLRSYFESETITAGSPAGGTVGADTVWALTNATIAASPGTPPDGGSYSLYCNNQSAGYALLDITASDCMSEVAGTAIFYLYVTTPFGGSYYLRFKNDAANQIIVEDFWDDPVDRLRITYTGTGTSQTATTTNVSSFPTNQWIKVTIKWSQAGVGGNYLYIDYDDANSGVCTSALTAMAGAPYRLDVGNTHGGVANTHYFDYLRIYNVWK